MVKKTLLKGNAEKCYLLVSYRESVSVRISKYGKRHGI